MNEKKQIKITFESKQDEVIKQNFEGELFIKNQSLYIKYIESIEQQEIRHLIRYTPNELKITRNGAIQSEQLYRLHENSLGSYNNDMIRLQIEVFTTRLIVTDKHNNSIIGIPKVLPFHLSFDYEVFVDGKSTGRFEIRLTIEEANV